jgi:hypothetical protein
MTTRSAVRIRAPHRPMSANSTVHVEALWPLAEAGKLGCLLFSSRGGSGRTGPASNIWASSRALPWPIAVEFRGGVRQIKSGAGAVRTRVPQLTVGKNLGLRAQQFAQGNRPALAPNQMHRAHQRVALRWMARCALKDVHRRQPAEIAAGPDQQAITSARDWSRRSWRHRDQTAHRGAVSEMRCPRRRSKSVLRDPAGEDPLGGSHAAAAGSARPRRACDAASAWRPSSAPCRRFP